MASSGNDPPRRTTPSVTNLVSRMPGAPVPPSILALAKSAPRRKMYLMQTLPETKLVGYIELEVGSLEVQVPIRATDTGIDPEGGKSPLASFVTEGEAYAIVVRGDSSSLAVEGRARGRAGSRPASIAQAAQLALPPETGGGVLRVRPRPLRRW